MRAMTPERPPPTQEPIASDRCVHCGLDLAKWRRGPFCTAYCREQSAKRSEPQERQSP